MGELLPLDLVEVERLVGGQQVRQVYRLPLGALQLRVDVLFVEAHGLPTLALPEQGFDPICVLKGHRAS